MARVDAAASVAALSTAQALREGARRGFPIVLGYLPLGFAFGVLALQNGIPGYAAVLMSLCVFAGSGQFIAVGMWGNGASPTSIIVTSLAVNLRYLLMCASLAPWLAPFSRLQRILFGFEIVDESFALHSMAARRGEAPRPPLVYALNMTAHSGWIAGTFLGVISGELLGDSGKLGLDYALPAMFLALLVPLCADRLHLVLGLFSAALAVGLTLGGAGSWSVIIATVITATIGAIYTAPGRPRQDGAEGEGS